MTAFPLQPPIFVAPDAGPLTPEHLAQLDDATRRQKKIRRAISVANTDAWLSAIFAGLTILSGVFSLTGLILGAALGVVAWNAFQGVAMLRRFDLRAPRRLALNQFALAGILIVYALYCILTVGKATSEIQSALGADPQVASMLGSIDQLYRVITYAVYGGLILGTIVAQGLAGWYYASRAKHLQTYIAATPDWIRQLQSRA